MKRGKFVVVVAPSGSGKNTLIDAAKKAYSELATLVTCTTRTPRPGEIDGVHRHFLSREEFDRRIEAGEFLEWAEYGGNRYGTLKSSIEEVLSRGAVLLADIEVQGARRLKTLLPKAEFTTIYVEAGGWGTLLNRITGRAPMSEEEIAKRYERYLDEITFKPEADYIVDNPDHAQGEAEEAFVALIGRIISEVHAGV